VEDGGSLLTCFVSFKLSQHGVASYDSATVSQALCSIDNLLVGLKGNAYMAQLTGGGIGAPQSIGYQEVGLTVAELSAGTHEIATGAYLSRKVRDQETRMEIDSVRINVFTN